MMILSHPETTIPEQTLFDPSTSTIIKIPERHLKPMYLKLEHSLMSVRKWEAEYERSFSDEEHMSAEDLIGYIKCMTINTQKDESIYDQLSANDLIKVSKYIDRANSAYKIRKSNKPERRRKSHTVESIYYAMIQYGIPIEPCETWHLGSLMALIDYFGTHGNGGAAAKPKNMRELRESWYRINEANRKKYNSRG